jgi:hypothetical protein
LQRLTSDVASLRDDRQVLTAIVHRLDNSHTRLLDEDRATTLCGISNLLILLNTIPEYWMPFKSVWKVRTAAPRMTDRDEDLLPQRIRQQHMQLLLLRPPGLPDCPFGNGGATAGGRGPPCNRAGRPPYAASFASAVRFF